MRPRHLLTAPGRAFYGWRMVAIGMRVNAVGGGTFNQGFAVFFLPVWGAVGFPLLTSYIFDSTGSDTNALWILIGGLVLGAVGFARLRAPSNPVVAGTGRTGG